MARNNRTLENDIVVKLRMPAELRDKGTERAQEENITFSALIRRLLRKELEQK